MACSPWEIDWGITFSRESISHGTPEVRHASFELTVSGRHIIHASRSWRSSGLLYIYGLTKISWFIFCHRLTWAFVNVLQCSLKFENSWSYMCMTLVVCPFKPNLARWPQNSHESKCICTSHVWPKYVQIPPSYDYEYTPKTARRRVAKHVCRMFGVPLVRECSGTSRGASAHAGISEMGTSWSDCFVYISNVSLSRTIIVRRQLAEIIK